MPGGISLFWVVLLLGAGGYLGLSALMAHRLTRTLPSPLEGRPEDYGLPAEEVLFPSRGDGLPLQGWLLSPPSPRGWMVLVHGWGGNRSAFLPLASLLVPEGIGVLLFDLRGHGLSPPSRTALGLREREDVLGAVDFLARRGIPRERTVLLGVSLGAVSALLAAAEEPSLAGLIADSPFAHLTDILAREVRARSGLPSWFIPGMRAMSRLLFGVDPGMVRPLEAVSRIHRPILFIHGEQDTTIPPHHSRLLWERAPDRRSLLWVVPEAEHAEAFDRRPEEYLERVKEYLRTVLP